MGQFPVHVTEKTFTVFIAGVPYQTARDSRNWEDIKTMVKDPATTADQIINAIKPIDAVAEALAGQALVEIIGGEVIVNGEVLHSVLSNRVLDIFAEDLPVEPWVLFIQNLFANPFVEARVELYPWMERAQMPITGDGGFLAFKVVNSHFKDRYSRTFDNRVGQVVTMDRADCDNTSRELCSQGLHFCSKDYLPQFGVHDGDHIMVIKINPADVVSIPANETAKGRTWRYEVVNEISPELAGIKRWLPVDPTWDDTPAEVDTAAAKANPVVLERDAAVEIHTTAYGTLTFERFATMRANNGGTNAALARALDVPVGTVSDWARRFRGAGCPA